MVWININCMTLFHKSFKAQFALQGTSQSGESRSCGRSRRSLRFRQGHPVEPCSMATTHGDFMVFLMGGLHKNG